MPMMTRATGRFGRGVKPIQAFASPVAAVAANESRTKRAAAISFTNYSLEEL